MRDDQKDYLARMEMLRRESIASVLVQPSSSKDVLTDKQRARVLQVRAMLERDENPFTHEELKRNNKELVGPIEKIEVGPREMSQAKVNELEARWKSGEGGKPTYFPSDSPFWDEVGLPNRVEIEHSDKPFCSFCGIELDEVSLTRGKGATRISSRDEVVGTDPRTIVKKYIFQTDKLLACPDCSLKIKQGNVKFPQTEG
jgi:hypothetical protein